MHYVIGDVHGCYDELMELLGKIKGKDLDAEFIFIGDLIDRGPKVDKVLEWAMEHISMDGEYQSVRGNHEQMVIDWYEDFQKWWAESGKSGRNFASMPQTRYDFSYWLDAQNMLEPEKIQPIIDFFHAMPYSRRLEIKSAYGHVIVYRIVHAWYDYRESEESDNQHHSNIWERNYWGNINSNEIIIHGHTPTIAWDYLRHGEYEGDAPGMICYRRNAINLDGGCCFSDGYLHYPCMLCAICLETLEEIYPYTLEERFRQIGNVSADDYRGQYRKKIAKARQELLERIGADFSFARQQYI